MVDRRRFIRSSATAVAGATLGFGCARQAGGKASSGPIAPGRPGGGRRVVVVGAGLAGLSAAYELSQAGAEVTVLEARARPGGRVYTVREPFDGQYAEMGAEYVDASDSYLRAYCKKFGLEVLPAKLYDAVFLRGRRFKLASIGPDKQKLPYEGTHPGMLFGQERPYVKDLVDRLRKGMAPAQLDKLDQMSVEELLLGQGAPPDVVELYRYLTATEWTTHPGKMSALEMLKDMLDSDGYNEETSEGRILGGNDRVPYALAKALGDRVLYERPVVAVHQDRDGARVTFEEAGKKQTLRADALVLALPFTLLRRVDVTPALSPGKAKVVAEQAYGTAMKIAMQFEERFWDQPGSLGQRVLTDTRLRRVYHHSLGQKGPRGILMSFTSDSDAAALGRLPERERLQAAREVVQKLWPGNDRLWVGGVTHYWNEDPWTRGSYSFTGVGQSRHFLELARAPEGRLYFAGEHTSEHRATMNGAVESGQRAAREVLERVSA